MNKSNCIKLNWMCCNIICAYTVITHTFHKEYIHHQWINQNCKKMYSLVFNLIYRSINYNFIAYCATQAFKVGYLQQNALNINLLKRTDNDQNSWISTFIVRQQLPAQLQLSTIKPLFVAKNFRKGPKASLSTNHVLFFVRHCRSCLWKTANSILTNQL